MTVEDQLRAAGRAVADQVTELPLLARPARPGTRARRHRTGRVAGWLMPLTAVAAVALVAIALVIVRDLPAKPGSAPASTSAGQPGHTTAAPVHPMNPESLPAYFVEIRSYSTNPPDTFAQPSSLVVRLTRSGSIVASVTAPAGTTFTGITGASDDRTFIVDSQSTSSTSFRGLAPHTWFLLRIAPGTARPMVLTMLAVPKAGMTQIHGIAQSPDGTRFAVLYQSNRALGAYPPGGPISMGIYSSATGALTRQWSFANPQHQDFVPGAPGESLDSNLEVSWTSDGRHLAFMDRTSSSIELRVLDVASQGNALFADARVVLVNKVQTSADIACQTFWLSSDERSVRCGALMPESTSAGAVLDAAVQRSPWTGCNAPASASYPGIIDIDLRSRKLVGVLYEVKPDCMGAANSRLLWVSPSGQTMLGLIGWNDDPSMTWHENLVLYSQGRATLLAHAAAVAMERADAFAF